jgi:hypothetical protein
MANTYVALAKATLTSDAASIELTAINGTYTDLLLVGNGRADYAGATARQIRLIINSDTGTNYSKVQAYGNGATVSNEIASATANMNFFSVAADSTTANTYGSFEFYIAGYSTANNKPISTSIANENNSTTGYNQMGAGLYRSASAITSLKLDFQAGNNFKSGTSIWLYGIKNS